MIRFSFLDSARFEAYANELFRLLRANMEGIAPGELTFEEWHAAVSGGLQSPKRRIVLMLADEVLAGFFQYYVNETTFMMEEIQIRPEYQQCYGIFRKLYEWLLPQMVRHPLWVEAYNHPQNEKSHGILLKMGLQLTDDKNGFRHYRGKFSALLDWLNNKGGKTMYQTILFDLDGTLTDPGLGITNSVMYALKKWGIEVTDRTSLYRFIGPPLQDSFMQYYGFSKEDAEKSVVYYREYFREKGLFENEVYPGAEEMLAALKADGRKLAVATSKPEEFAIKILKHFHLDGYFDVIAGATMDSSRSKKADVIAYCLETLGVSDLSTVVMVGDREHDIIGAKTVGVDSIGVLVGYGSREELETAGATYVAETLGDVAGTILKGCKAMNYRAYFNQIFPGFFERDSIRSMPEEVVAEELILDLHTYNAEKYPLTCPEHISFGWFKGDVKQLKDAVREVDDTWVEYFNEGDRVYCAFDGEKVVSFCIADSFGEYQGLKVGGPGCVGTIPSYRRQGIGLKMVQNATLILKKEGYDISHIHYTGVGPWYMHMGYKPVLKWNCKGFVDEGRI